MRKFVTDQILLLIIGGVTFWTLAFHMSGATAVRVVLLIILVLSVGCLCQKVLLLPFDMLVGKREQPAYFSATAGSMWGYEFFRHSYFSDWKFYWGNHQTIHLLAVDVCPDMYQLKHGQKVKITYYRLSRILLSCEIIDG